MALTVGVTFFLHAEAESIWNNGAGQNAVFLWQLLRAAGHRVVAINGGSGETPHPGLMYDGLGIEFARVEDVVDQLDVLIETGAQVEAAAVARVRQRGGRAIAYKFGNAYVIDTERVVHGHKPGAIFNGAQFDEVWTHPQHVRTCASYWEATYRCPVRVLPHIWEPLFLEKAVAEFPDGLRFGFAPPSADRWRVGVFEPNINIVKTAVVPMLVCELAHRRRPGCVDVYVTNALKAKDHLTFQTFAGALDIVRERRCSFEGRYNLPWFMARHCDAVVAHQWENGLNYAYYDALWGGYPLVHNSPMIPVGYRYHDFDAHDGASALLRAMAQHDPGAYRREAQAFLATVRATAPANIEAHERALSRQ